MEWVPTSLVMHGFVGLPLNGCGADRLKRWARHVRNLGGQSTVRSGLERVGADAVIRRIPSRIGMNSGLE